MIARQLDQTLHLPARRRAGDAVEAVARARLRIQPDFVVVVEREIHRHNGARYGDLPEWNQRRREAAERYRALFVEAGEDNMAPFEPTWARAVYHLYVVRTTDREGLMRHLAKAGIGERAALAYHLQAKEAGSPSI